MSISNLDLRKSALLVIDMQNAFCHPEGTLGMSGVPIPPLRAPIEPLRALIERCHAVDMPVIWTVQEHFERDLRRARKRLPSHTSKRKGISALAGTWDAAIVDELEALAAKDPSLVIRKHRFGAFHETRLDMLLAMLGVEALFVTGVTANACVETSIREGYLRDLDVVAVTDCIGAVNADWEAAAQKVWQQYLAALSDSREVLAWMDEQMEPRTEHVAHLLLQCSDMERSARFYLDLLGFQRKPDAKPLPDGRPLIVTLQGLGLTGGGPGDRKQVDHIAFKVRNVRALAERIKASDTVIERDLGPGAYGLTIYVRDPDGNIIELFE